MNAQESSLDKNISINRKGFTIIEVLMAMSIFLIGFLAVGSMQIAAVNGNTSARMRTSASILTGDIVEQLMRCPYNTLAGCTINRYPENDPYPEGDPLADGNHPGPSTADWYEDDPDGSGPDGTYQVRWVVKENGDLTIKEIDVFVRWQRGGRNNSVQYSFIAAAADL